MLNVCNEIYNNSTLYNINCFYHIKTNNIYHLCICNNSPTMPYMTLSRVLCFFLFIGLQQLNIAQCSIENLSISIIDCVNDNNAGLVLDFESETPSTIGYQISTQLGFEVIQYSQLPYTLIVSGNCITDYTLTIKDLAISDCETTQNVGVICCDVMCNVEIDIIELQCQDDESILATVDFNVTGTLDDSLDIFTNDEYISTIAVSNEAPFLLPGLGTVQNLVVCTQGTTCCDTVDIVSPCVCNILDIHAAVADCDPLLNEYFLRIDFKTTSPSSDSFNLGRPGNALGTHAYADLPIRVGPISFEEDDNDIFILDQSDALCFGFIPHNTLESCDAVSCTLSDLNVTSTIDCAETEEITYHIDFNTTLESQGFQIIIDGTTYGPFLYGEDGYAIGPLATDGVTASLVEIIDLEDDNCNIDTTVTPISCDCSFDNLVTTQFCNDDVLIALQINFEANGSVNDSFDIASSISTQRFAYSDLPITLNGLPTEDISLEVVDVLNPSCSMSFTEDLECVLECAITNFEVALLSCVDEGVANFSFTFDYEDFTTDTVTLSYNDLLLGNYIIADTTEYLIPLLNIDCDIDFNTFSLAAINDIDCAVDFAMPNIDCCTPCQITNLNPIVTCDPILGDMISYNFDYSGNETDTYQLYIADELFGEYLFSDGVTSINVDSVTSSELPIELTYEIVFPLCSVKDTIMVICSEECIIENIQLDTLSCTDGLFTGLLNFDHADTNDSFMIFINDVTYGSYAFDQLPLEVGPIEGDGSIDYTLSISVIDFESCIGSLELGQLDCGPNSIDEQIINNINWSTLSSGILIKGIATFEKVTLIDLNGRQVFQQDVYHDELMIQNKDYTTGLYFVRLQDEKGNLHTIKIIL